MSVFSGSEEAFAADALFTSYQAGHAAKVKELVASKAAFKYLDPQVRGWHSCRIWGFAALREGGGQQDGSIWVGPLVRWGAKGAEHRVSCWFPRAS